MYKLLTRPLTLYYFPVFIFFIIVTGDSDSLVRKILSFLFSGIIILASLPFWKIKSKSGAITFFVSIYLFIALISVVFSVNPVNTFYIYIKLLFFFSIIISLYFWLNSYDRLELLIITLVLVGVVQSFSIFMSVLSGNVYEELEGNIRVGGLFSNVNTAGFICYTSIIFSYFKYLLDKSKGSLILICVLILCLILTGSRASLLALFVSFIIYNLRFSLNKKLIVIIGVLFLSSLFIGVIYKDKIKDVLRLNKGLSAREVLYDTGVEIIKDYPFTGIGLGNLKEVGSIYIDSVEVSNWRKRQLLEIGIQSSHNAYIETAVEIGVFGALIFLFIVLAIGYKFYMSTKANKSTMLKNFYFLFFSFWCGVTIRSFFESNGIINRGWITIDIYFWIVFVVFLKLNELMKQKNMSS